MLGYVDPAQEESAELSAALLGPSLSSDSEGDCLPSMEVVRKRIMRLRRISATLHKLNDDASEEDDDLTFIYASDIEAVYPYYAGKLHPLTLGFGRS